MANTILKIMGVIATAVVACVLASAGHVLDAIIVFCVGFTAIFSWSNN